MDKDQLEKEMSHENQSTNIFINEIEGLQEKIKQLGIMKENAEARNKENLNDIKKEMIELENRNSKSKETIAKLEKDLAEYKENKEKRAKELEEYKSKSGQKDKEIATLKSKVDGWEKEKSYLTKDFDDLKKSENKLKAEYKDIVDKMKSVKENHNNELKKLEEQNGNLQKKLENEKNQVIVLGQKLKDTIKKAEEDRLITTSTTSEQTGGGGTLSDVLESVDDEKESLLAKTIQLQNEISTLNSKIQELTTKNQNKANAEIDVLKKQNDSLKLNIKEVQEMYENQIKELQKKTVNVNAEYQNFRRTTTKKSVIGGDPDAMSKYLQIVHDLENKIGGHEAEVKYLNEKIELLKGDIETQKKLREKDILFYKEEIKTADAATINAKVTLAQTTFEKDDTIMQVKLLNKKLKMQLNKLQGIDPTNPKKKLSHN